jgi:acetyl-CoA carboxylase carboxyltransferase component
MLRRKRKTKNEIAGFFRLNARKLAKSKRPVSQKTTHDQRLIPLFTGDHIDDVIMPHATRLRIARALAMLRNKHVEMPARKHDNLPV